MQAIGSQGVLLDISTALPTATLIYADHAYTAGIERDPTDDSVMMWTCSVKHILDGMQSRPYTVGGDLQIDRKK